MNKLINFIESEKGQDYLLILETAVTILAFFWLLKNHKIIKE